MKRSREPEQDLDPSSPDGSGDTEPAAASDTDSRRAAKIAGLDSAVDDGHSDDPSAVTMPCHLPPHHEPVIFASYAEYEAHYHSFHTNRCLECRKNFPSQHLLGVHIEECHDPLAKVRRDNGEHTFSCFVEGCERKCLTHQKRRLHMIDKHLYPKNFFFAVTKDGIDGRRSLLNDGGHRRRRSSAASQTKGSRRRANTLEMERTGHDETARRTSPAKKQMSQAAEEEKKSIDTDMDDITGAMSSLQFVPSKVKFGRGRAGFAKQ